MEGSSSIAVGTATRLYFLPHQLAGQQDTTAPSRRTHPYWLDRKDLVRRYIVIYTIFEGTSEIQRLIIARAISGVHIR
jgi:alkylation response protein AidB-like acyl-CoA dehydrogenase